MPDKPLETTWIGTRVAPAARRARRAGRRLGRRARSTVAPRIGILGAAEMNVSSVDLSRPGVTAEQVRRCDVVVLETPDDSGIPRMWRDVLILAERQSVPTVLVVKSPQALEHPLAAVVTHLVTPDARVLTPLREFAGAERTALLPVLAGKRDQMSALFMLTRQHTPQEED